MLKNSTLMTECFLGCDNGPLAEVEIMIAEPNARGQKMGIEAVSLMIRYGIETLKIPTFQAKIKDDNIPSIKMFQKLGFELVSDKSNVFGELELKSPRDTDSFLAQLKSNFGKYELQDYVRWCVKLKYSGVYFLMVCVSMNTK